MTARGLDRTGVERRAKWAPTPALALALALAGLGTAGEARGQAPPADDPWVPRADPARLPIWPGELERLLAPLAPGTDRPEAEQLAALEALADLPPTVTTPPLLRALASPHPRVRGAAAQRCLERNIPACTPVAAARVPIEEDPDLVGRMLQLAARHPGPAEIELLIATTRAEDESLRRHATALLGPLPAGRDHAPRVAHALLARLADLSASVRSAAAQSLGEQAVPAAPIPLVRLLDDPEPAVRAAAARALGRVGDQRALGPLGRALDRAGTPELALALLEGIAGIGGPESDARLLSAFDTPPPQLARAAVIDLFSRHPAPGTHLAEGLVRRLATSTVRDDALAGLRALGEAARAPVQAALQRGVEPTLARDLQRLLDATAPGETLATPRPEADEGPGAVLARVRPILRGMDSPDPAAAARAGVTLGELRTSLGGDPGPTGGRGLPARASIDALVHGQLSAARSAAAARPWLIALVAGGIDAPELDRRSQSIAWTRVAGWAASPASAPEDRCLATLALAHGPSRGRAGAGVRRALDRLRADPDPEARACAAFAALRRAAWAVRGEGIGALAAAALSDPAARVRGLGALALADAGTLPPEVRLRLARLVERDPHVQVQAAAAFAISASQGGAREARLACMRVGTDPGALEEGWARVSATPAGHLLWLPAAGSAPLVFGPGALSPACR